MQHSPADGSTGCKHFWIEFHDKRKKNTYKPRKGQHSNKKRTNYPISLLADLSVSPVYSLQQAHLQHRKKDYCLRIPALHLLRGRATTERASDRANDRGRESDSEKQSSENGKHDFLLTVTAASGVGREGEGGWVTGMGRWVWVWG